MIPERKECPDCRVAKDPGEFGGNRERPDGLSFYCRACMRRRSTEGLSKKAPRKRISAEARRGPTPDGHRYCSGCQGFVLISDWFSNRGSNTGLSSYCKRRMRAKGAESHLKRKYGLSTKELLQVSKAQNGLCAICRNGPAAHVDHDHVSGQVRGLLCFNCNAGFGLFKDRTVVLAAAITYLRNHKGAARPPVSTSWPRVIELFPCHGRSIAVGRRRHTARA